jgi:hypothetical protein
LPRRAAIAFRNAGATEEMIAAARLIYGSLPNEPPGRPRMYKNAKEADHAFYMRHRDRIIKLEANRRKRKNGEATHALSLEEVKAIHASPQVSARLLEEAPALAVAIAETIVAALPKARVLSLKEVLVNAAGGNVDREADVLTIRAARPPRHIPTAAGGGHCSVK